MATATLGVKTPSSVNASTYDSDAFTPTAGALLIAIVSMTDSVQISTMTDTQNLGWTRLWGAGYQAGAGRIQAFVANTLAAAVSTVVTFDCTGDPATGAHVNVVNVAGMTRVGTDAIRQSAAANAFAAAATPDTTFGVAVLTGNLTIALAANLSSPAGLTPPTNWTERADAGYSTPTSGLEWATRNSGFTGTTITWGGTSATGGTANAIEVDASQRYAVVLNDNFTNTDAVGKTSGKVLDDAFTNTEALGKAVGKPQADSLTVSDDFVKGIGKVQDDSFTNTDSPAKTVGKVQSDTFTNTDAVGKGVGKTFADTITGSDSLSKGIGKVLADTITGSDSLAKSLGKALGDTLSVVDALRKAVQKAYSDSITITDVLTKLLETVVPNLRPPADGIVDEPSAGGEFPDFVAGGTADESERSATGPEQSSGGSVVEYNGDGVQPDDEDSGIET